jgi:uncharacterized protein (TIGR02302 family)
MGDRLRQSLSWFILSWERAWRALWPTAALGSIFCILALFDLQALVSGWLHLTVLTALSIAVVGALVHAVRIFRTPDRRAALYRLERVNALDHRPLEALEDEIAGGDNPTGRTLWRLHRDRMRRQVHGLRIGWPHPGLIRRDPWALRIALAVMLVAALVAAGSDAPARLERGLKPKLAFLQPPPPPKLDAWLTPPAYTGFAPIFLTGPDAKVPKLIETPAGSVLAIRISGGDGRPTITRNAETFAVERLDAESYKADLTIRTSETVILRQEETPLAKWTLRAIPDAVPKIAFVAPPAEGRRAVLRIDFRATDDYGLATARAVIKRPRRAGAADSETATITLELPLPRLGAKRVAASSFHNLTPHPWAGLPVDIHLLAEDTSGRTGRSGILRMKLPERHFGHPVARAIIIERRKLIAAPEDRDLVGAALRDIAWNQDAYDNDVVVFMALTTAARHLGAAGTPADHAKTARLLWETALRVEDGKLSIARQSLRAAEKALQRALKNATNDRELAKLLDQLESALNSYFDELGKFMEPLDEDETSPMSPNQDILALTRQDFKKMMEEIRKLVRSGSRSAAKRLLSRLRNLLETMRSGQFARMTQQGRKAMRALDDLQGTIKGQRNLLDRTFRRSQRGKSGKGSGKNPAIEMPAEVDLQETLRRKLGDIMRRLGEMTRTIPRALGRGERAMRRSTKALRGGRPGDAVAPQTRAIDQLQEGARQATRRLMEGIGQGLAQRSGNPNNRPDPLGRSADGIGGVNTTDVGIPSGDSLRRAREIRDELRRRAGQRSRPIPEREYINRLLKQF